VLPAFTAARSAMIGLGTNVMVRYLAQDDQSSAKGKRTLSNGS
jgi:predicted nucleic-acid-binding protein